VFAARPRVDYTLATRELLRQNCPQASHHSNNRGFRLELNERREGRVAILAPVGKIDLNTSDLFRERLLALMTASAGNGEPVVLDFSGVDYISSAGLRVLMLAAKQAHAASQKIAVAALQPVVLTIFRSSRFEKVVPCHPDMAAALTAVAAQVT